MSGELRKGSFAWVVVTPARFWRRVEVVEVIEHKGARVYVVELRSDPDVILGVRQEGAIWRDPPFAVEDPPAAAELV